MKQQRLEKKRAWSRSRFSGLVREFPPCGSVSNVWSLSTKGSQSCLKGALEEFLPASHIFCPFRSCFAFHCPFVPMITNLYSRQRQTEGRRSGKRVGKSQSERRRLANLNCIQEEVCRRARRLFCEYRSNERSNDHC